MKTQSKAFLFVLTLAVSSTMSAMNTENKTEQWRKKLKDECIKATTPPEKKNLKKIIDNAKTNKTKTDFSQLSLKYQKLCPNIPKSLLKKNQMSPEEQFVLIQSYVQIRLIRNLINPYFTITKKNEPLISFTLDTAKKMSTNHLFLQIDPPKMVTDIMEKIYPENNNSDGNRSWRKVISYLRISLVLEKKPEHKQTYIYYQHMILQETFLVLLAKKLKIESRIGEKHKNPKLVKELMFGLYDGIWKKNASKHYLVWASKLYSNNS
jgi:hypothetical protein